MLSLWLMGMSVIFNVTQGARESLVHHCFIGKRFCQAAPFAHQRDLLVTKWPRSDDEVGGIAIVHAKRQGCGIVAMGTCGNDASASRPKQMARESASQTRRSCRLRATASSVAYGP